jgi:hypothetical protein
MCPPLGVHGCKPLDAFRGLEGLSPRFTQVAQPGRVRVRKPSRTALLTHGYAFDEWQAIAWPEPVANANDRGWPRPDGWANKRRI